MSRYRRAGKETGIESSGSHRRARKEQRWRVVVVARWRKRERMVSSCRSREKVRERRVVGSCRRALEEERENS